MAHLRQAIVGRCFFISTKGRMGLCNPGVQCGSLVAILDGGRTPYFISERKVEGCHRFLGECYIEGIMNGEEEAQFHEGKTELCLS